jgi:hypothetical protein
MTSQRRPVIAVGLRPRAPDLSEVSSSADLTRFAPEAQIDDRNDPIVLIGAGQWSRQIVRSSGKPDGRNCVNQKRDLFDTGMSCRRLTAWRALSTGWQGYFPPRRWNMSLSQLTSIQRATRVLSALGRQKAV